MSYVPDNLRGPNDNMSQWTRQYPALLKKNFIGLARIWNKQNLPPTFSIVPPRNMPFNFQWQVKVDPSMMAPYVQEGADTPMSDAQMKNESFLCKEARLGSQISQRAITFGIANIVQSKTQDLVNAINLTRIYDNINTILGVNVNQPLALTRINTAVAGKPHGKALTAKGWDESGNLLIKDVIAMKTDIQKKCGQTPTDIYIPINENEYLHDDSAVLDQLKYTNGDLLVNGRITRLKGLNVHVVPHFWLERKKNGEEVKHWILQDKVIMTTGNVGFTAVAEPRAGSAPQFDRWYEKSKRSVLMHAFSSFVTVIEDYGKIGIISGTDSVTP